MAKDPKSENAVPEKAGWVRSLRAAGALVILALTAFGVWKLGVEGADWNARLLVAIDWLEGRGLEAALWLALLQAVLVVSLIPGPYFTLASGFLFGLAGGAIISVAGSTLGAVAAYWIARRVPGSGTPRWIAAYPGWRRMEAFIIGGDWKMVLSTRLVPLFPFKLSNYFFGRIRFPFWPFFWGTLVGIGPITMISVSAGAMASDVAAILGGRDAGAREGLAGTFVILLLSAGFFFYLSWRTRARVEETTDESGGSS